MTLTITARERDALYGEFVTFLSGIDALWQSVVGEDFERADRLAREYSDALEFVVTDLRWGSGPGEPIELKTDPQVLRRALERFREKADTWHAQAEEEVGKARSAASASAMVVTTVGEILRGIDGRS